MLTSNPYFDELCKQYGPFYATMKIAKSADAVCNALPGRIDYATAIDRIANYQIINPDDFPDHRLDVANDYLSTICDVDPEVKAAVLSSYGKSLDCDALVFDYMGIKEKPRRSKVRWLTKLLWWNRSE